MRDVSLASLSVMQAKNKNEGISHLQILTDLSPIISPTLMILGQIYLNSRKLNDFTCPKNIMVVLSLQTHRHKTEWTGENWGECGEFRIKVWKEKVNRHGNYASRVLVAKSGSLRGLGCLHDVLCGWYTQSQRHLKPAHTHKKMSPIFQVPFQMTCFLLAVWNLREIQLWPQLCQLTNTLLHKRTYAHTQ